MIHVIQNQNNIGRPIFHQDENDGIFMNVLNPKFDELVILISHDKGTKK